MAVQSACPPVREYERLLKSGASAEQSRSLLEHLESCPQCWETIGPMIEGDTLVKAVAPSGANVPPELIDQLLALQSAYPTSEFGAMSATPTGTGDFYSAENSPAPANIGNYHLERLLGRGGMGAVYLARDARLNRMVALKVMLPHFAADASAKERFLREGRAAAQIANDHVVTIYEADERDGVPYIAMQLLQGASLEEHLRRREEFSVPRILRIAQESATGLAAAHALGLIHRDIKPGNLWLEEPGGRVKVLDFGLAKPLENDAELTDHGKMIGTPAFMSPEQARCQKLDARSDLFSLGVVLYRLCTGRLPFEGANATAVLTALAVDAPPSVRSLNPGMPEALAILIHDLLIKEPSKRPANAAEVVDRVRRIIAGQPEPVRKKPRRTPLIATGLLAVLALIAAGVIIIIKHKDGTETKIDVPDGSTVTVAPESDTPPAFIAELGETEWEQAVAKLTTATQMKAVEARLKRLNPNFFDNLIKYQTDNGVVVRLEISDSSELANLAPLRALTGLKDIHIHGRFRNPADISPLRGMKLTSFQANGCPIKDLSPLAGMPLYRANFWGNVTTDLSPLRGMKLTHCNVGHSQTKDISVLKGMPLEELCLNLSQVDDLSPLIGARLKYLFANHTKVTDLSPIANMPIEWLSVTGSSIKDYSPLRTLPLIKVELDDPKKHADILRAIPTLKLINSKPVGEVLGDANAER